MITSEGFLPICDMVSHPYIDTPFEPKDSGVILCHSLTANIDSCLRDLTGSYIMIAKDSDDIITNELVDKYPQVKWWYATNCHADRENVTGIPAGVMCGSGERSSNHCDYILQLTNTDRIIKDRVFACFNYGTERMWVYNERNAAMKSALRYGFTTRLGRVKTSEFLQGIYDHEFTLSPYGCGEDCLRTWEAMYLGSIPIIRRSKTYDWFEDMPIAMLDTWDDLTPEWLDEQKKLMKTKSMERMTMDYWLEEIRQRK